MYKIIIKKVVSNLLYSAILFVSILFIAFILFRTSSQYSENSNIGYNNVLSDFYTWLSSIILSQNFGETLSGRPVLDRIFYPVIHTVGLTFSSLLIGFTTSIVLGWYWADNSKSKLVNFSIRLINSLSSVPLFLAAFIILWGVHYVVIDIYSDNIQFVDKLIYYLIPVLVLTFFDGFFAEMINFIKISIDNINSKQFINTLELRGGNKFIHIMKHIFHDLLSIVNSKFLNLIGGAIVVEIIFGWEGIGIQGLNAVLNRDYSLFMGILTLTTVIILVFNLITITFNYLVTKKYQLNHNR